MEEIINKNLDKLNRFVAALNGDDLMTKEEFLKSFKNVLDLVVKIEKRNTDTIEEMQKLQTEVINEIKVKNTDILNLTISGLRNKLKEKINDIFLKFQVNQKLFSLLEKHEKFLSIINLKIEEADEKIKNLRDGKDADEDKIIQTILSQIKLPEIKDDDIEEKINKKMNPIIDIFRKNWEDKVQDVLSRRGVGVGGGRISQIIAETPSGALNGSNTTFTLTTNPKKNSLLLLLNGQGQRQGSDKEYTLAGKTITMIVAPLSTDTIFAYYTKF